MQNSDPNLSFYTDGIEYSWENTNSISSWLKLVSKLEDKEIGELSFILTSDEILLTINKQFLNHDFYTDVITFQNDKDRIDGEIYISWDRIVENAAELNVNPNDELHRVIVHGVLHMIGYGDKTSAEETEMRDKEDFYLNLRHF